MMMNLMTVLVKKVFISSKPSIVCLLCPPPCGPFSIQESAVGGLSYKVTIECLQSVHSIIHDNRMFAERAFYCLLPESVKVNGLASLCRFINCFQQLCNNQSLLRFYSQRSALGYCIVENFCFDICGFFFCAIVESNTACT